VLVVFAPIFAVKMLVCEGYSPAVVIKVLESFEETMVYIDV
jgi:hypothetical protein